MAARSPEAKAASNFLKALSVLDFDFGVFGVVLAQAKPIIQNRVLEVFMNYVDALAYRHSVNAKFMDAEEIALCLKALEMQKAMRSFR